MRTCLAGLLILISTWGTGAYGYNVYYGNLHAHTALSDGIGTPEEAYTYARDVADIDILALTEHTHMLTPTEWDLLLTTADAMTEDGVFIALGAQEFGNLNDFGHMSIYESAYRNPNPTENLAATYQFIQSVGAFANFNHPNPDYGTNFNNLSFVPDYVDEMVGLEIRNGIRADDYEEQYVQALQNGWHVGPLANQDNHEGHWGDQENPSMGGQIYLTGFLADELTKEAIVTAYREKRFYAMEVDPPSDRIELEFYGNGAVMGQEIETGPIVSLTGTARAVNGTGLFNRVDLFQDGVIVDGVTQIGTAIDWWFQRALQDGESHFYFVRVRQVDGDFAWSAPIWAHAVVDPASAGDLADPQRTHWLPPEPNPFSNETLLTFRLAAGGPSDTHRVSIELFNLEGTLVGGMVEPSRTNGVYRWSFEARDRQARRLPAGVYLCRLTVDGRTADTRRLVLIR